MLQLSKLLQPIGLPDVLVCFNWSLRWPRAFIEIRKSHAKKKTMIKIHTSWLVWAQSCHKEACAANSTAPQGGSWCMYTFQYPNIELWVSANLCFEWHVPILQYLASLETYLGRPFPNLFHIHTQPSPLLEIYLITVGIPIPLHSILKLSKMH